MTRVPLLDSEEIPPHLKDMLEPYPVSHMFRTLPHSVPTAEGFIKLGVAVRDSSLGRQLCELVILRVGALSRAPYEIHHHRRKAAAAGLSPERIAAALQERDEDCLTEVERRVMRFTDAVVLNVRAPEFLYLQVAHELGTQKMIELLHTIGYYMLVVRMCENLDLDITT
jgi:4-carboxymuconolactone decarboxylase